MRRVGDGLVQEKKGQSFGNWCDYALSRTESVCVGRVLDCNERVAVDRLGRLLRT